MTDAKYNRTLTVILFSAFILRIAGIGYGLPHIYHQDEPIIVNHAMAIGVHGWNPQFFVLPPFTIYLCFVLYGIAYVGAHAFGLVSSASDFGSLFIQNPSLFYVVGRGVLGALFGTASVYVLSRMARRHFNAKTALLSSALLALSFLHVQHSHYIYTDIPLTFFIILMFHSLLNATDAPTMKHYVLTGVWLGLATSVKYTAIFFTPILLLAHIYLMGKTTKPQAIRLLVSALAASIIVFATVAPYTFLDWANVKSQLLQQANSESYVGLMHHLTYSILNGTSWLFVFFLFFALAGIRRSTGLKIKIVALASGWFYVVNIFFSQPFARYMMPILPLLCILASIGWSSATAKPGLFQRQRWTLLFFLAVSLAVPSLYSDYLLLKKDTRDQALSWIHANVSAGKAIAVDSRFYAPRLYPSEKQLKEKLSQAADGDSAKRKRVELALASVKNRTTYDVYTLLKAGESEEGAFLFDRPYIEMSAAALRRAGVNYLVISTAETRPEVWHFLADMGTALELKAVFNPYRDTRFKVPLDRHLATAATDFQPELFSRRNNGPYLEIYEIK